ncbi:Ribosomal protein S18 acetylase RimI [Saccharicrinis carchari]|uniref:Ribosomal protein S18 acetylase RimI n=1 Tax=Saccharicrinis carchari TaxID=1168039 RepID=A0A521CY88_SACCC|nr:GNAT family N-acetyltransferase [Saccharicrinis carchari]SMO64384.1 Ribosomal protein S18 acetylase RimI [Saccharicrinis carchari]
MIIRKANSNDAEPIAEHILLAMEDIVHTYIGQKDYQLAKNFLLHFIKSENNQYSYQNCFVMEEAEQVIATVNLYDGAILKELRQPVIDYINEQFNTYLPIEDETQAGEIYIDSLGVDPSQQGKGLGLKMLTFLIDEIVNRNQQTLGLLVDKHHPNAKKLYLKAGFKQVGTKVLLGNSFEHLQITRKPR